MSLRKQFETWCKTERNHNDLHRIKKCPSVPGLVVGEYMNPVVELAWQAFQAGHAVNAELLGACELAKKRLEELGLDWLGSCPDPLEKAIAKAKGETV